MIRGALVAGALIAAVLAPSASLAGVQVRFFNPERYTDAGSYGGRSTDATLVVFRTYLERLGARFLAPGQTLTIDVLNIDLAGQYEPWRPYLSDVRIMRDITPPSVRLRFVLSEKGRRIRSGEEHLTDLTYQMNPSARFSGDRYVYEKACWTTGSGATSEFVATIGSRGSDLRHDDGLVNT
jgi:hypothetical protein